MTLDSMNPNLSRVSTAKLADSPSLQSDPVIVNHAGHKYVDPGKNDAPMKPEGFRESSAEFKSSNLTEDQKKTADKVIDVAQNTLGPDHSNSVSTQTPALTPKPSVSKKVKEKIIADRRAALDKPTGDSGVTLLRCYAKASAVNLDRASKIKSVKKEIFEDKKAIIEAKIDLADPKTKEDFKEDILDFIDRSEKRIQANQDLLQGLESNDEEIFLTALEGVIRPKIDGVLDLLSKTKISSSKKLEITDDFGDEVTGIVSSKNDGKDLDIRITVGIMGQGGFSTVYQAVDLLRDQPVVIKIIDREKIENPEKKAELETEIHFIEKFKKVDGGKGIEGVVGTHDIVETEDEIFIVQECCVHGDVYNRELDKPQEAGRTLLETMATFEREGIVHRDIKPSNIFEKADGTVRLGDFGFCAMSESEQTKDAKGTILYAAPEHAENLALNKEDKNALDSKADVYSAGITLYQMHHGTDELPFAGEMNKWLEFVKANPPGTAVDHKEFNEANESHTKLTKPVGNDQDAAFETLVWEMMRPDPKDRPTFKEALERYNQIYPTSK